MGMGEVEKAELECQLGCITQDSADVIQKTSSHKQLREDKSSNIRSIMLTTAPQYLMEAVEKSEKQEGSSYSSQKVSPREGIGMLRGHKEKGILKNTGRTTGFKAKLPKKIPKGHPNEAFVNNQSSSAIEPNGEEKTRPVTTFSSGPTHMSHPQNESPGIQSKHIRKKGFRAVPPAGTQSSKTRAIVDTVSGHVDSPSLVEKGICSSNRSLAEEEVSQKTYGKKLGDAKTVEDSMKSKRSLTSTVDNKGSTFSAEGRRTISTQRSPSNSVQEIKETSFGLNTNVGNAVPTSRSLIGRGLKEMAATNPSSTKYEASTNQMRKEICSLPGVGHHLDTSRRLLCKFEIETEQKGNKFLRIFEVRALSGLSLNHPPK
jgi:hypothetical protein